MKKICSIVLIVILLMSLCSFSYANTPAKEVLVSGYSDELDIGVGDTITLTAVTPKRGSSYVDTWIGANHQETYLDKETGDYVSTAVFTAEKSGIYKIEYEIIMQAGRSSTTFTGRTAYNINVNGIVEVSGAEIRDISIVEVLRADGSLAGYSVMGNVYILWNDGTSTMYSTVFFFFAPNETTRDIAVSFEVSGKKYNYIITVTRE